MSNLSDKWRKLWPKDNRVSHCADELDAWTKEVLSLMGRISLTVRTSGDRAAAEAFDEILKRLGGAA